MRYQKIESRIWNDEKFIELTPVQQRLFLYILTCPHGNLIGLFVLKKGYILEDLKVLPKDLERDFEVVLKSGMIGYDPKTGLVWVKNFLKHNPLTNPNQHKAVPKIIDELPKSYLIQEFIGSHNGDLKGVSKDFARTFEGLPKPDSETDSDTEEENTLSAPPVPYAEIFALFNEILGEMMAHASDTEERRKEIKHRWKSDKKVQSLEWWKTFFTIASESDFLTGRSGKWTACNIDWLLKKKNFQKVREGTYNNR